MKVKDPQARAFYEREAARENWATRELERQVASMLLERLILIRDKDKVLALAKEGQQVASRFDHESTAAGTQQSACFQA